MSVRCTSVYWDDRTALDNMHNLKNDRAAKSANPLTKLLKPLLRAIAGKRRPARAAAAPEEDENAQNERNERAACECAAAAAADADSRLLMSEVRRAARLCVPVHFVRTDVGTFFWTAAADRDLRSPDLRLSDYQSPAPQAADRLRGLDRWAQA